MSSTRWADPNAPISQERYMSSPEFFELNGISGLPAAKRCALLGSTWKRELVLFYQGRSLEPGGGLKQVAREVVKMFPERLSTPYTWELVRAHDGSERASKQTVIRVALGKWSWPENAEAWERTQSIEEFIVDLCINPKLRIEAKGEELDSREFDEERAKEEFPELQGGDFKNPRLCYFRDIIGALVEYKRRYEQRVKDEFCTTAISREVWAQIDHAIKTRTMILLDGLEGRGKTEAAQAYCKCHLGQVRFASLRGTATKTDHFRALAGPFGIGRGLSRKVSEMQSGLEEVLRLSGLGLVADEAHYFFSQSARIRTRPEMLDWIDTALCNPPLPLALVTTPQFLICMERAVNQVGWNFRQFRRRCKTYKRLAERNTPEDIQKVVRHLLPEADSATVKQVMGYEALCKRDLSAVGDVAREAKLLAQRGGARKVSFEYVKQAVRELMDSDVPWAEMEARLRDQKPAGRSATRMLAVTPSAAQDAPEPARKENLSRGIPSNDGEGRARFTQAAEMLVGATG